MKRFQYRFESVAKVRKIEMEKQARVMAEAQLRVKKIQDEMADIARRLDDEVQRLQKVWQSGKWEDQLLQISSAFRDGIKKHLVKKKQELREAEAKVEVERRKLIDKERGRQVMEKIRERDYESYLEEKKKDEAKEMDEVASQRFYRNNLDGGLGGGGFEGEV